MTDRHSPADQLAALNAWLATNPPPSRTPENWDLTDAAADRAANRATDAWFDGVSADRQHDRRRAS